MRCYNQTHRFYCGVDLHARSLLAHALNDSPFDVELAVLLDRFVGTERFLRRRSLRATVVVPEGASARPRKAVWCRPASPEADTASTNHPDARKNRFRIQTR
jgi:hypothetical protein